MLHERKKPSHCLSPSTPLDQGRGLADLPWCRLATIFNNHRAAAIR